MLQRGFYIEAHETLRDATKALQNGLINSSPEVYTCRLHETYKRLSKCLLSPKIVIFGSLQPIVVDSDQEMDDDELEEHVCSVLLFNLGAVVHHRALACPSRADKDVPVAINLFHLAFKSLPYSIQDPFSQPHRLPIAQAQICALLQVTPPTEASYFQLVLTRLNLVAEELARLVDCPLGAAPAA